MNMTKLLKPKSVAIIGASEQSGFGGDTCRNILQNQENVERVYFVHPQKDQVFGRPCYPSISVVPDDLDLVMICTSQNTVEPLLREAKEKSVGAAVVYASGYSEMGTEEGREKESRLAALAEELDLAVMGPNCAGYINFSDSIFSFAFIGDYRNKKGSIGFISQSGQFCIDMMKSGEMKYSYAISAGNSGVVQMEDYLDYLVEDPGTRVVALYLEGVKNPGKFEASLKKAAMRRKPVVILKAGRSPKGQATAASHTGSLAGSDQTYDAVFEKFGVLRADDMQDLRSTASLLATLKTLPKSGAFTAMCLSGGETAVCADTGYLYGLEYPDFEESTLTRLNELLPDFATPRNPLDMTAALCYDAEAFAEGITTVMGDPNVEMGLIGFTISDTVTPSNEIMYEGIRRAAARIPEKPLALLSFMEASRNLPFVERFLAEGIPVLPTTKYAFSALRHLRQFVEYDPRLREVCLALPISAEEKNLKIRSQSARESSGQSGQGAGESSGRSGQGAREIRSQTGGTRGGRISLSEYESKKMLAEYGVDVHLGKIAKSREEALTLASEMGLPLVMKIESADILHKSDVGGVKLNLNSLKEVETAYNEIQKSVAEKAPQARINGVLMQRMLHQGTEMIIGVNNDPQFGPMVLVGMGGVFVEVFQDAALYPAPLKEWEAQRMVESLKSYRLLKGYRGGKPADIPGLVSMMVKISEFAVANKDRLKELDINPLFVYPEGEGVAIADALTVLQD